MKLAIKIGSTALADSCAMSDFAVVLRALLYDGHTAIVVHGGARAFLGDDNSQIAPAKGEDPGDMALMVLGGRVNKYLVATLGAAGVPAIGICGADGNTVRLRRVHPGLRSNGHDLEVATVNPFWLDAITRSGGVPVLANVALGPDARYHYLCADELAGACAIGWRTDALIFLTGDEGFQDSDGKVVRWLGTEQITALRAGSSVPDRMLSKLIACQNALTQGVNRTRIFPARHIQNLPSFFTERLNFGTEIIPGDSRTARVGLGLGSTPETGEAPVTGRRMDPDPQSPQEIEAQSSANTDQVLLESCGGKLRVTAGG